MFWFESAIVARYTKFLWSICWYLQKWPIAQPVHTLCYIVCYAASVETTSSALKSLQVWCPKGKVTRCGVTILTVNILQSCLYSGSPWYTGSVGCSHLVTGRCRRPQTRCAVKHVDSVQGQQVTQQQPQRGVYEGRLEEARGGLEGG